MLIFLFSIKQTCKKYREHQNKKKIPEILQDYHEHHLFTLTFEQKIYEYSFTVHAETLLKNIKKI